MRFYSFQRKILWEFWIYAFWCNAHYVNKQKTSSLSSLMIELLFFTKQMSFDACYSELNFVMGVCSRLGDSFLVFPQRTSLLALFARRRKLWRALKDAIGPVLLPVCLEQRVGWGIGSKFGAVKRHRTKAPDKRHQKQHFVQVAGAGRFSAKGCAQKLPRPTVKSERVFTAGAVKEKERSAPRCFLERLLLDVSRKRLPLGHVRLECMLSQNTRL